MRKLFVALCQWALSSRVCDAIGALHLQLLWGRFKVETPSVLLHDSSSERPSPEPLLKREGETSGNFALNYRAWEGPAILSSGIPGKALREFPGIGALHLQLLLGRFKGGGYFKNPHLLS